MNPHISNADKVSEFVRVAEWCFNHPTSFKDEDAVDMANRIKAITQEGKGLAGYAALYLLIAQLGEMLIEDRFASKRAGA